MTSGTANTELRGGPERIRLTEVMRLTGLPRSTIYNWMKRGIFPKQAAKPDGTRSAYWYRDEVVAWLESGRRGSRLKPEPVAAAAAHRSIEEGSRAAAAIRPAKGMPAPERQIPEIPTPETRSPAKLPGFERTGMIVLGQEVYRHCASGRLMLDIGYLLPQTGNVAIKETGRLPH